MIFVYFQAQIVIDWLENIAFDSFKTCHDAVEYYGGTHIAWENTLKTLRVSFMIDAFGI